jgi:hypothetical protein
MARNNNGNQPRNARRDSATERSAQKPSKTATVTSTKDTPSKADRMFQRAWKDTYEKRDRRVG